MSRKRCQAGLLAAVCAVALLSAPAVEAACGPEASDAMTANGCAGGRSHGLQTHGERYGEKYGETYREAYREQMYGGRTHSGLAGKDEAARMRDGVTYHGHTGERSEPGGTGGNATYHPGGLARPSRTFGAYSGGSHGSNRTYGRRSTYGSRSTYGNRSTYGGRRSTKPRYRGGSHYRLGTLRGSLRRRHTDFDYKLGSGSRRRHGSAFNPDLGTSSRRRSSSTFDYNLGTTRRRSHSYHRTRPYSLGRVRCSPGWDRRRSLGRGTFRPN